MRPPGWLPRVSERRPAGSASDIAAVLSDVSRRLGASGIEQPRLEARRLLAHVLGREPGELIGSSKEIMPPDAEQHLETLVSRREHREPLAFIQGRQGFWTLDLEVSRETLIPRADSEALIEAACVLELGPHPRVLDLGTGTGCLLLAVLSEYPGAFGVGVDLARGAAACARRNAKAHDLEARSAFFSGNWGDALAGLFDLVISNPPYIETASIPALMPEVVQHEPWSALDGGRDGLNAYRRIMEHLLRLLRSGGFAILELGQGQRSAVEALATGAGLHVQGCHADLGGHERALILKKPFGAGSPQG
ncbi:peptide chain release factor N(5)-glutamine methyltransferase [Pseudoroseomonas globiformis]|uniref:Release factor glutamine methyltransferase n=1 Tax=Teichococcus globiformis TaxID=2307229 RepID=A0ABV7G258_9PROT